ncbi:MAG: hypothetical protein U0869_20290 [Chloroflexota bacterium]
MRPRSVLLALSLVATASLGAGSASAAAPVTYSVPWPGIGHTGADCVSGIGPASVTLDITLRDGATDLQTVHPGTDGTGAFQACFDDGTVLPGRSLVTTDRTFVLPALTASISRPADRVTGKGPKGARLVLSRYDCPDVGTLSTPGSVTDCKKRPALKATIGATGRWAFDAGFDVRAVDTFLIVAKTAEGDQVGQAASAPLLLVSMSPLLTTANVVLMHLGSSAEVVRLLSRPGGTVLAEQPVIFTGGSGSTTLTTPVPGNQVTASVAPDARLTIPDVTPKLLAGPARIRARCFPGQPTGISLGGSASDAIWVKADAAGLATLPLAVHHLSAAKGNLVAVYCESAGGDLLSWASLLR